MWFSFPIDVGFFFFFLNGVVFALLFCCFPSLFCDIAHSFLYILVSHFLLTVIDPLPQFVLCRIAWLFS